MKNALFLSVACAVFACAPASAAIISLASNVDLSAQPSGAYTVPVGGGSSYTFTYTPGSFSPISLATGGSAEVYGNGFFSQNAADPLQVGAIVPDQLSLGQFFQINGSSPIAYSIAQVNVALRFVNNGQTYYGYAQVGGSFLNQLAFNDTPGGSITTGEPAAAPAAVPESATWAMMVGGFGVIGGALRRRKVMVKFA